MHSKMTEELTCLIHAGHRNIGNPSVSPCGRPRADVGIGPYGDWIATALAGLAMTGKFAGLAQNTDIDIVVGATLAVARKGAVRIVSPSVKTFGFAASLIRGRLWVLCSPAMVRCDTVQVRIATAISWPRNDKEICHIAHLSNIVVGATLAVARRGCDAYRAAGASPRPTRVLGVPPVSVSLRNPHPAVRNRTAL